MEQGNSYIKGWIPYIKNHFSDSWIAECEVEEVLGEYDGA